MSIASLIAAAWFILVGVTWLDWISIDGRFLGLLAFILGIIWLIEGTRPLWRK